jgi:hypothetical protein
MAGPKLTGLIIEVLTTTSLAGISSRDERDIGGFGFTSLVMGVGCFSSSLSRLPVFDHIWCTGTNTSG